MKETKIMWIDKENYFIHKAEFYTKSGCLFRSVVCSYIKTIDGYVLPANIFIKNMKLKTEIHLHIRDIILNHQYDFGIFIPSNQ